jgi:hypothetical protein
MPLILEIGLHDVLIRGVSLSCLKHPLRLVYLRLYRLHHRQLCFNVHSGTHVVYFRKVQAVAAVIS